MPITLVTGPENAGKTSHFLNMLRRQAEDPRAWLIVPDGLTARRLRKELLRSLPQQAAIPNQLIMEWSHFLHLIAAPEVPLLSPTHTTLIILSLLAQEKLHFFGQRGLSWGLAQEIGHGVRVLKSHRLPLRELHARSSTHYPQSSPERDLFEIGVRYEEKRERQGFLDEGDLWRQATHRLSPCSHVPLELPPLLLFDAFLPFTPSQLELLRALSRSSHVQEIMISAPLPPPGSLAAPLLTEHLDCLSRLADQTLELQASRTEDPLVEILTPATPLQESRAILRILADEARNSVGSHRPLVITPRRWSAMDHLLTEAHAMGLASAHVIGPTTGHAPWLHACLAPEMAAKLPRHASLAAFAQQFRSVAFKKQPLQSALSAIIAQRHCEPPVARTLAAMAQLDEALRHLETASRLLELPELSRDHFLQMLSASTHASPPSPASLQSELPCELLSWGTPLALPAKRMIIANMLEGHIPDPQASFSLFTDWQDEEIASLFPSAEQNYALDTLFLESLLMKCQGVLTFMTPALSDRGSETLPSSLLKRFDDMHVRREKIPTAVLAHQASADRAPPEQCDHLIDVERARRDALGQSDSAPVGYHGKILSKAARQLIRKRFTEEDLRTTALERYLTCPFAFFSRTVLKIDEPEEMTVEVRRKDRGILIHEILKRFALTQREHLSTLWNKDHAQELREIIARIAQEVCEEASDTLSNIAPGLHDKQLRDIVTMCVNVVETELDEARHLPQPLLPAACEWSFGSEMGTALTLPLEDDQPAKISGRVDRIDLDREGNRFLIIDYKSGRERPLMGEIRQGKHLQLPLYICAVKEHLFPCGEPIGGLLIAVRDAMPQGAEEKTAGKSHGMVIRDFQGIHYRVGKRSHSLLTEEHFARVLEMSQSCAAQAIAALRAGDFARKTGAACSYCAYEDACRYIQMAAD